MSAYPMHVQQTRDSKANVVKREIDLDMVSTAIKAMHASLINHEANDNTAGNCPCIHVAARLAIGKHCSVVALQHSVHHLLDVLKNLRLVGSCGVHLHTALKVQVCVAAVVPDFTFELPSET